MLLSKTLSIPRTGSENYNAIVSSIAHSAWQL
jgi:hypothetical protein